MFAPEETDEGLMRRLAAGDRQAFEALIAAHGPAVTRLTSAILGDGATAQDAAQEALLSAFRRAATWQADRGPVRPWLLAIARHEAARHRPARETTPLDDVPLAELGARAGWGGDDPERLFAEAEERDRVWWALASLSPTDREVLTLRELEGLSGDHAAAMLDLELPALKSRLHRARLNLMAALREGRMPMAEKERVEGGLRCSQVRELL
ncbi:MAG: RNA polymerase sigma factor, partial [Archangium sp.]|nr:RNA polymerase sigma factor [Archangium sp.]